MSKPRGHIYWDVHSQKFLSVVPPEDGDGAIFVAVEEDAQRVVTVTLSKAQLLLLAEDCRAAAAGMEGG